MPRGGHNKVPVAVKKRYMELLRGGYRGAAAARVVGVSTSLGSNWFLEAGGMLVPDACTVVCDGLSGLPDAVAHVWPQALVQTCIVHLIRGSFRYAARQDWDKIARALKPVYTAPTESAAMERWLEFAEVWGTKYPAIVRLWENAWQSSPRFCSSTPKSARSSAARTRSRA